jgi:predicted dehydrogenase
MTIDIGIVGAGNRGEAHATQYADVEDAHVVAIADVDESAATALADALGGTPYFEYRDMLQDADLDAIDVCVHNNLHRPVAVDAAAAGCHVFCEKPLAASYADAAAMVEAAREADVHLGVQNYELFSAETTAAKTLVDDGEIGEPYFARGVFSRRRGRPYVDGYGTPSFVTKDAAGGGAVIDVGTYVVGRLLYLLGNAHVERVSGATFEHTADSYDADLVGDAHEDYEQRLEESGYDVEDAGMGFARLEDGSLLTLRAAWHMFLPDDSDLLAGSKGGVQFDPFEYYTTASDYEATVSLDLEEFERRHALLESESGYEPASSAGQYHHWVDTIRGVAEPVVPTGEIALNSMLVMEGIYRSEAAGRELTADEIADRSESTAVDV